MTDHDRVTLKRDLLFHKGMTLDRTEWERHEFVDFAVSTFPIGDNATGYLFIPVGEETDHLIERNDVEES